MSIFTSIVSKLLHWYFLQEITHDIVMLGRNVCFTQKRNSHMFS